MKRGRRDQPTGEAAERHQHALQDATRVLLERAVTIAQELETLEAQRAALIADEAVLLDVLAGMSSCDGDGAAADEGTGNRSGGGSAAAAGRRGTRSAT